ncbi:hypothetical protein C1645_811579 [Glomus cerebriforme]|uniref:Uncharacterized protein n=1 Tax=Glomus cerebriforme TaxID=658196 RepID=A0A397TM71_9GLOM|nr:hypothetical protein C1645_811579 [Glomus cerebriforme]
MPNNKRAQTSNVNEYNNNIEFFKAFGQVKSTTNVTKIWLHSPDKILFGKVKCDEISKTENVIDQVFDYVITEAEGKIRIKTAFLSDSAGEYAAAALATPRV